MPAAHYFIVMVRRNSGLEAIVDPEQTRRGMIAAIVNGETPIDRIEWIHETRDYADGQPIITEDITEEVKSECRALIERKDDFRLPEAAE